MLSCSQHRWFYTLLNMGLGEVGTTITLHSSTGEELIYVKAHAVQEVLQQKPSSQLMKHMVKGS